MEGQKPSLSEADSRLPAMCGRLSVGKGYRAFGTGVACAAGSNLRAVEARPDDLTRGGAAAHFLGLMT